MSALVRRPLLRGYLHAGAAVAAAIGGVYLLVLSDEDRPRQLSLLVYGLSLLSLFVVSALYHLRAWAPARAALLQRLDHANIALVIAATYTAIAFNVLAGWWRVGILGGVWSVALAGGGAAIGGLRLNRSARAGLYVAMGWIALVALPQMTSALPAAAIALIVAGGVLYSAGALLYARRWPDLWPRVFGYHEVFHLLTVAATALFYLAVVIYVLPAPRP